MAKIDIAGELNAATTERIVADSAQIRFNDTTVEKAMVTYGDSDEIDDVPGGGGGDDPGTVTASIPSILLSELDNLNMDAVHGNGNSIYKVMLTEGDFLWAFYRCSPTTWHMSQLKYSLRIIPTRVHG